MVRPENDPSAEGVAEIDDPGADHEPDHVRQRALQRQDQHVVGVEKTEIPEIRMEAKVIINILRL